MQDATTIALVFLGGGIGSLIRWRMGTALGERQPGKFPLGTFVVNVTGSFMMGFLSTLFSVDWRDRYGSVLTALVLTGVLGGYTTFSSYQLDSAKLYNSGERSLATLYWATSILAGLVAAALGWWLARMI